MSSNAKKTKLNIFFLVLVFFLPVVAGWILYQYHDSFHFKTMNHGKLVSVPVDVKSIWKIDEKQKIWRIVFYPGNCCDEQCEKIMYSLHQLKIALGKDSKRAGLFLAINSTCKKLNTHDFQKIISTSSEQNQLQNELKLDVTHKIFLVDPRGYLFMYYPESVNPIDILKDLKRVFEVSQIG